MAVLIADMRAHRNPTRMRVLRALSWKLAKRLERLCPKCDAPGFGSIGNRRGLPCEVLRPAHPLGAFRDRRLLGLRPRRDAAAQGRAQDGGEAFLRELQPEGLIAAQPCRWPATRQDGVECGTKLRHRLRFIAFHMVGGLRRKRGEALGIDHGEPALLVSPLVKAAEGRDDVMAFASIGSALCALEALDEAVDLLGEAMLLARVRCRSFDDSSTAGAADARLHPKNNKAARRRLCADNRRSYRQRAASAGTIPVATAAKLVGVALVDVTGSPPFKVDGPPASHSMGAP